MELDLTKEEIIVLSGLLRRYSESKVFAIQDQAEQRALWNLECVLEKTVGCCFEGSWEQSHYEALKKLRDESSTNSIFEKENGRLALWLEPQDIEFITSEWRKVSDTEQDSVKQSWAKLAFRCNTALHKLGLKQS